MGAEQIDGCEQQVRGPGLVGRSGEEREEGEEERGLVVDAAVVGGDIVKIEVETFLHWQTGGDQLRARRMADEGNVHLLKLETGVESSTRPARRAGSWGKAWNSSRRRAAAATKRAALCLEEASAMGGEGMAEGRELVGAESWAESGGGQRTHRLAD